MTRYAWARLADRFQINDYTHSSQVMSFISLDGASNFVQHQHTKDIKIFVQFVQDKVTMGQLWFLHDVP